LAATSCYKYWSDTERQFLVESSSNLTDSELVEAINSRFNTSRKLSAVRKMRQRLGLAKASGRGICQVKNAH
jgi:transposase